MCAELEGILLWCLEGLHRLVQNDFRITVSERAAANVDTIKRSSNNVIDFMESEGYFRFKADCSISSCLLYTSLPRKIFLPFITCNASSSGSGKSIQHRLDKRSQRTFSKAIRFLYYRQTL